jgi:hypothetical protein
MNDVVSNNPSGISPYQLALLFGNATPTAMCNAWYDFALGNAQTVAENLPSGEYVSLEYLVDASAGPAYATGQFSLRNAGWTLQDSEVGGFSNGSSTQAASGTLTITALNPPAQGDGKALDGGEVAGSASATLTDGTQVSLQFDAVSCSTLAPPP